MNVWITIAVLHILTTAHVGNGYEYDTNNWRPLTPIPYRERPVDIIVDIVNDLGIKLLDCYMERPGNVAFSPAGLAFVLAALYEGSAGRSNRQIGHILGLPRDRRITRIGLRDVHRRLRSYLNADTFLGGLTLNRDDITLRPEYEDVLRFYGFNVANVTNNNDTMENTTDTTTNVTNAGTITMIIGDGPSEISTPLSTTIDAALVAATANDTFTVTSSSSANMNATIVTPSFLTDTPLSPQIDITTPTTTINPLAEIIPMVNTNSITSTAETIMDSTLSPITTLNPSAESIEITTVNGESTNMNNVTDGNQTRLIASTDASNSDDDMQTIIPTVASVMTMNSSNQSNVVSVQRRDDNNVRKRRDIKHRRSFPIYQEKSVRIDDLERWQNYPPIFDDIVRTSDQGMTQLSFLVHGCDVSTISTITYTAILPFAYFPVLHALALEFPLDDPRYNVIVFMPTEGTGSRTLNHYLASKTLRQLRESLKPTWIRTTIPSFTLRGFVTLTPYLQRLGIRDTFEPRTADLSPMSPDLGIYARDVQQSIGVNIRYFMKDTNDSLSTMTNTRSSSSGNILYTRTPIPFIADRPFLFFIIDNETSIALIAGRVDDPLNSRII